MRPAHAGFATSEVPQNKPDNWFQRWRKRVSDLTLRMNTTVARSPAGRFFRLKGSEHVSVNLCLIKKTWGGQYIR